MNNSSTMAVYGLTLIVICCTLNGLSSGSPYFKRESEQELSSHPANNLHIRRKRHISEQLVADKRMKQMRHNERILLLHKLMQHAGPDMCKCKISRNSIDDRSRLRGKSRRFRAVQSRGCTCDMLSTLRQLFKRVLKGDKRNHGNDPLTTYLSTLDDRSKINLRIALQNEIARFRRLGVIRNLQRAKEQRKRTLKRRNPHRAFHGINLFMG